MVSVPLTSATRTRVLLNFDGSPSPTTVFIYEGSTLSSQPHTLYCWHRQSTGRVSFLPLVVLWKLYGCE
jgi:hypothetical protein